MDYHKYGHYSLRRLCGEMISSLKKDEGSIIIYRKRYRVYEISTSKQNQNRCNNIFGMVWFTRSNENYCKLCFSKKILTEKK